MGRYDDHLFTRSWFGGNGSVLWEHRFLVVTPVDLLLRARVRVSDKADRVSEGKCDCVMAKIK